MSPPKQEDINSDEITKLGNPGGAHLNIHNVGEDLNSLEAIGIAPIDFPEHVL